MLPKTAPQIIDFREMFIEKVNERAKGEMVINYRGGPEIIGQYDLGVAVQTGIVDLAVNALGFYEPLVPGIGAAMLSTRTPQEERAPGGAYYYLVELHKKGGLYYLGRAVPGPEGEFLFYVFLRKKTEKPQDFVGLRLGSGTAARAAVLGWGATASPVQISDYYTAMERNLVDGIAGSTLHAWVTMGAQEVTKYVIDHPFYQGIGVAIMNLNTWNKLPKHLQNLIMDSMIEFEKWKVVAEKKRSNEARQKMIDSKVEFYKLAPPVADWFIKTAYNAAWEYHQKKFPEATSKLKELLSK
jgi:TRAP-type C4-dicarboxylate transport system substrate-binding protein